MACGTGEMLNDIGLRIPPCRWDDGRSTLSRGIHGKAFRTPCSWSPSPIQREIHDEVMTEPLTTAFILCVFMVLSLLVFNVGEVKLLFWLAACF